MQENKVLSKNPNAITRTIEGETILLPLYRSSDEIDCIYTLNKTASEVWNLIDGKKTLTEIKKRVLKKFDTTPEEVDKEMQKFLKDLKKIKAVK